MENPGIGLYSYSESHPYRATEVDLTEAGHAYYQDRGQQSLSYNAFKKPVSIHLKDKARIDFSYNPKQGRSSRFYGSTDVDIEERPLRKHYSADGQVEISTDATSGQVAFLFYVGGDAYTAPAVLKSDGETAEYLYLHRDYLGSILAISDQNGQLLEKRHFDAWGNIVHLQDGQDNDLDVLTVLDRGYTGHEHLESVALIHMNGRLYDPILHRFLAPDNYVQDPYNTQNFNRYGYVLNSPLMYTDPSGELGVLAAIAIGAAVAAGAYTANAYFGHAPFTPEGLIKATLIGAVSGAVTFGIGEAAASISQLVPKIAMQAVSHGMFQGTMAGLQGGNYWQGFAAGAIASLASSGWGHMAGKFAKSGAGQILFGTISGGAGAALSGGNFWEGAAIGFVVSAVNHYFHDGYDQKGRKINNKGGDQVDYMYDEDGNIIASTAVEIRHSKTSETEFRMYGLKVVPGSGAMYDPTWDILGGALPVSKLFSGIKLLKVPVFRFLGESISKYAPSLNKGRGLRIGISKANNINSNKGTRKVFRITYGNRTKHFFNIDLGKWGN